MSLEVLFFHSVSNTSANCNLLSGIQLWQKEVYTIPCKRKAANMTFPQIFLSPGQFLHSLWHYSPFVFVKIHWKERIHLLNTFRHIQYTAFFISSKRYSNYKHTREINLFPLEKIILITVPSKNDSSKIQCALPHIVFQSYNSLRLHLFFTDPSSSDTYCTSLPSLVADGFLSNKQTDFFKTLSHFSASSPWFSHRSLRRGLASPVESIWIQV